MAGKKKTAKAAPEPITRKWLDGLLDRKLNGMLGTIGKNPAHLVTEFVKLVQLDRRLNPRKKSYPEIIWVDWPDQEVEETRL
jgi:hypothetical protein